MYKLNKISKSLMVNNAYNLSGTVVPPIVKTPNIKAPKNLIVPEQFSHQPFDNYTLIKSKTYEFLMKNEVGKRIEGLMKHQCNTPSAVLKKPYIHIFADGMPELNKRQKYTAFTRSMDKLYEDSYNNKSPKEIFHLDRKIKMEIRNQANNIGFLHQKHKHYRLFKTMIQFYRDRTIQEYQKKGVKVSSINATIFPKGQLWLPTNQQYLTLIINKIHSITKKDIKNVLDIGCGSGIITFLLAKYLKNSILDGFDINPNAVLTTQINAQLLKFNNINVFQYDVRNYTDFDSKIIQWKLGGKYDIVTANPPWIVASELPGDGPISKGVYDHNGQMLNSTLKLSKKVLRNKNSRLYLIYSDISQILGLEIKSVQVICAQNNLNIYEKTQHSFTNKIGSRSVLNKFKQMAKIQLYQIGLC